MFQFSFSLVTQSCLTETPQTAACQVSLSITNSWSLLKLMSIESMMPSNHLVLCHPLLFLLSVFPSIRVFSSGQSIGSVIGLKQSEVAQSCPTLCDPMESSLSGSSIHGIFQARILEWVAISFSRASSRPRDRPGSPALQADSLRSELSGNP